MVYNMENIIAPMVCMHASAAGVEVIIIGLRPRLTQPRLCSSL